MTLRVHDLHNSSRTYSFASRPSNRQTTRVRTGQQQNPNGRDAHKKLTCHLQLHHLSHVPFCRPPRVVSAATSRAENDTGARNERFLSRRPTHAFAIVCLML